ncbi:hypothetical protein DPEC_G00068800 [Dallia pectoralis]|uniref:Uncharacterized protein n=1 Tax=Dallia pectoralis TaxID=75939 RepID=A0ACC2H1G2_DALPE|nr:hypothetical protein DPEC_G00068800 [Dallia pectoralis]
MIDWLPSVSWSPSPEAPGSRYAARPANHSPASTQLPRCQVSAHSMRNTQTAWLSPAQRLWHIFERIASRRLTRWCSVKSRHRTRMRSRFCRESFAFERALTSRANTPGSRRSFSDTPSGGESRAYPASACCLSA